MWRYQTRHQPSSNSARSCSSSSTISANIYPHGVVSHFPSPGASERLTDASTDLGSVNTAVVFFFSSFSSLYLISAQFRASAASRSLHPWTASASAPSFPGSPACPGTCSNTTCWLACFRLEIKVSAYITSSEFLTCVPPDVRKPFLRHLGSQSLMPAYPPIQSVSVGVELVDDK